MQLPLLYDRIPPHKRKAVREEYIRLQEGKCYACLEDIHGPIAEQLRTVYINKDLFPEFFFKHPIHLHHDHTSGLTIGAVHAECNALLWQYHGE